MNLVSKVVSAFIIRPVKPGEELVSWWVLVSGFQPQRMSDADACGGFGAPVRWSSGGGGAFLGWVGAGGSLEAEL